MAECPRCGAVFLCESLFYEIPGEVSAPQGERILYPTSRELSAGDVPPTAGRAYANAARAFRVGLYEPCLIMCRKCLEATCHELGAIKGNLRNRLVMLQEQGKIDQRLLAWADQLRLLGNDAAHDLNVIIDKTDAKDALDFVEAILMYTFSLTRRFEEFRRRRGG